MLATTFLIGYVVLRSLTRCIPYQIKHLDSYLICGLVCVTVYAQFFSLFFRVGLLANLVLCAVCAVGAVIWRRDMSGAARCLRSDIKSISSARRGRMFVMLLLFLLFAYGTSRGFIHYDTALYHAQSIRWIEEYGVVKGLGNLHCRLAYNSSSFALSALYSMSFLGGQSYHCCAGFLALILAKVCMEIGDAFRDKKIRVSDFARLACLYYLVNIYTEMISPASDYFMVLIAFYIVIRWLELLENEERMLLPYSLLCVLGVFLMTVKLSAALILLLVFYPAYHLVKDKRWKETGLYLLLGIVTALPYFIRNVLISGWLVYPFTQIDLFQVAWKIPKGTVDYDAREIQVWGRGYTNVAEWDKPVREWLPDWFRALSGTDKAFVVLACVSVCVCLVYAVGMICRLWQRRWDMLLVQATVAGSFLFWLGTSPLIRYGCVYVYLTSAVVWGCIYDTLLRHTKGRWQRSLQGLCLAAAALFCVYKGCALCGKIVTSYTNDYWLTQKDYDNYETLSYEINGVTFYYPAEGDQVGYESFPSSPARAEIGFIGEEIRDGFYSMQ